MLRMWFGLIAALCGVGIGHSMSLTNVKASMHDIISRARRDTAEEEGCMQADIVMVLDSSGSIGEENWFKVLDFAKIILNLYPVGDTGIRMGAIWYGNRADIAFHLNSYGNASDIETAIDSMRWKDEATNTSGGELQQHLSHCSILHLKVESMLTFSRYPCDARDHVHQREWRS